MNIFCCFISFQYLYQYIKNFLLKCEKSMSVFIIQRRKIKSICYIIIFSLLIDIIIRLIMNTRPTILLFLVIMELLIINSSCKKQHNTSLSSAETGAKQVRTLKFFHFGRYINSTLFRIIVFWWSVFQNDQIIIQFFSMQFNDLRFILL